MADQIWDAIRLVGVICLILMVRDYLKGRLRFRPVSLKLIATVIGVIVALAIWRAT